MSTQSEGLFRKKSLERISSPEQLDEYLKVTNPAVWLVFCGVIIFLAGVVVWSLLGHLDTKIPAAALVKNGTAYVYIPSVNQKITVDMPVSILDGEYHISGVRVSAEKVDADFSTDVCAVGGFRKGEVLDEILVPVPIADGVYPAYIITERITPFSLVFN